MLGNFIPLPVYIFEGVEAKRRKILETKSKGPFILAKLSLIRPMDRPFQRLKVAGHDALQDSVSP